MTAVFCASLGRVPGIVLMTSVRHASHTEFIVTRSATRHHICADIICNPQYAAPENVFK